MSGIAVIRTSDRIAFKRCRRKWGFSSHLRHNRTQSESAEYFWIGSGCHYAMEDYHGYNYYGHPVEAFRAYVHAYRTLAQQNPKVILPTNIDEQVTLGEGMLEYYLMWLQGRDPLDTLWVDGEPQCEVKVTCLLPYENEHYAEVYYQATFDRVVEIDGELWILDYKFYNRDWSPVLDFDSQMSAYIWLAQTVYERPVRGAILQKHFKRLPEAPRILSSGKLSTDKNQSTTYRMYRDTLLRMYGTVEAAPKGNRDCLNELLLEENEDRDKFIQRSRTERSQAQIGATGAQVLMELPEMLNPDLPLYKNDTKDCSWDCPFNDICLMMDQDMGWEDVLKQTTIVRHKEDEGWRKYLPHLPAESQE